MCGHQWGRRSQWCNRLLLEVEKTLEVVGFVVGESESEKGGGDETGLAREESQRQGAGRLFVAR